MSVQISYKKQFLIWIFLGLILLTVVETSLRIYENELSVSSCSVMNSAAYNDTEHELKEQICKDMNRLVYEKPDITRNQPNQHYETINVNSYGFRGEEITKEKNLETFRIFMVGGSTVFGAGSSSDDKTITGYLQKLLDKEENDYKFEVINAGVPGANSVREEYLIKESLLEFNPNMIIIYDGLNDAANAIINKNDIGKPGENQLETNQKEIDNIISKYFQWYRTPFMLNYFIFENTSSISYNENSIKEMKDNWYNRWNSMCEYGNSNNIEIIIALQPVLGTGNKILFNDEITNAELHESKMNVKAINQLEEPLNKLSKVCSNTLDLRNTFDKIEKPIFYDLGHTNELGNEIIAKKIFKSIQPLLTN